MDKRLRAIGGAHGQEPAGLGKHGAAGRGQGATAPGGGVAIATPLGTMQITQSEHNFDGHHHDADRDGLMDRTMNSQQMRNITNSQQNIGASGSIAGAGAGPGGAGLHNAMSQQQFLMGMRGSHQQLYHPGQGAEHGSVHLQGRVGGPLNAEMQAMGYADPAQRRINTLATLQHSSGHGSSAERLMMGQQMP